MNKFLRFALVLAPVIAATGAVASMGWADVLTIGASQDATIFATSAGADTGNASGKGPALFAGADGSLNKKRSMLEFDVSSISPGATITSVTLTLYLAQVGGSGGGSGGGGSYPSRTLRLYDLQQAWGEGNSGSPTSAGLGGSGPGYPRQNGDSTWTDSFYNSNSTQAVAWSAGGTATPGGNFSSTESAESTFTNFTTLNSAFTWSSAGMVADVQSWVNGTAANNGWLLKSDLESSATSFLAFWSKDGAAANNNAAIAPSLSITFTPVPEPASVMVLALGAPLLIARRKRLSGEMR